jgi:hypothetical protein
MVVMFPLSPLRVANPLRCFPAVPIPAVPEREVSSLWFTQKEKEGVKNMSFVCA